MVVLACIKFVRLLLSQTFFLRFFLVEVTFHLNRNCPFTGITVDCINIGVCSNIALSTQMQ
ncbi:hypothetical protein KC19_2G294300 [Ceratodon purpureus]|uniref:Uncharacterized protein n=1 Tax=Ceratodon purpureus TaxID=3225 RepID=A0A8T0J2P1_CERPU|nr:hypothetical protein KC19_2G294300 [Ceratodon purpureus]